jgi:anti-anti-sigma regulatory factor
MSRVSIEHLSHPGHAVLRLRGSLGHDTAPEVQRAITKALLDSGRVVLDLENARIVHPSRAPTIATALEKAGGWPQARLVLCAGTPAMVGTLTRSSVTKTVPHAPTVDAAVTLLDIRPPLVRRTATMDPQPYAMRQSRALVDELGESWDLPIPTVDATRLVINELTTNAVVHAGTVFDVVVEFDGTRVRLSVSDGADELLPRMRPPDPAVPAGYGLHLVERLSERWGVTPRRHLKKIWAIMPPSPTPPRATGTPTRN